MHLHVCILIEAPNVGCCFILYILDRYGVVTLCCQYTVCACVPVWVSDTGEVSLAVASVARLPAFLSHKLPIHQNEIFQCDLQSVGHHMG